MWIEFPRPVIMVGDCIAIWKRVIGHRREAGPCLKGRKHILFEGEPWKPSRLAYHLNVKTIPRSPLSMKTGLILHTCDNEWCVNPQHLYEGTARQNVLDLYNRHPTILQIRSASHIGLRHTESTKLKISKGNFGKVMSADARAKMSAKQKLAQARKSPEERRERARHASAVRWGHSL
jgi:hypothetical protein